jgi:hypothetical protein
LGIAGGICKRKWNDLGQLKDLLRAIEFYQRGTKCDMGDDAYPHINTAFVEDLLAEAGDRSDERRKRAAIFAGAAHGSMLQRVPRHGLD